MAAYTVTGHLEFAFTDQTDYDNMVIGLQNVAPNVTLSNLVEDSGALTINVDVAITAGS